MLLGPFRPQTGPPEVPRECDVRNHTVKSLAVACSKVGFAGGDQNEKQLFHLEVRDRETGELVSNQTAEEPDFTIR